NFAYSEFRDVASVSERLSGTRKDSEAVPPKRSERKRAISAERVISELIVLILKSLPRRQAN
ncbi:MAG: hypothetical protein PHT51_00005, partial [Patescibacteria group bacterium]|nr:hypothetical protein [Patescibacteria group bacterium]